MRTLTLTPRDAAWLGLRHDDTLVAPSVPVRGRPLTLSLWARRDAGLTAVQLRLAPDGEEELFPLAPVETRGTMQRWEVTITPRVPRLRYRFRVERSDGVRHYSMRGLSLIDPVDAFDFTLLLGGPDERGLPDWPLDAVLYQIFPDRFAPSPNGPRVRDGEWSLRGTPTRARRFGDPPLPWREAKNLDFYGGDLDGIAQHLDHLAAVGATGLFLNPIWRALSNHRYDIVDHGVVCPHLGGDDALARLAAAVHARDMRLVLDVVLNHTGSGHRWFNREGLYPTGGAYRDPHAPERAYYRFIEWPERYDAWFGVDTLPRLDLSHPDVQRSFWAGDDAVLKKYLRAPFSVDGYRFDVANMMGRDGERQTHRPLWTAIARALRGERSDGRGEGGGDRAPWLVGEHFFDPDKLAKGDGLDGVMAYHAFTFPLRTWIVGRDRKGAPSLLDAAGLVAHWQEAWARLGWPHARRSTLHVNTHDVPRLQTVAHDAGLDGDAALLLATGLQCALPGVPCLYYGDEVGLDGGADPDNRRCMEWDEARWSRRRWDGVRQHVAARRSSRALRRGGFVDLGSAGDVLAFARVLDGEAPVVVASRAREPVEVTLDLAPIGGPSSVRVTVPAMGLHILPTNV